MATWRIMYGNGKTIRKAFGVLFSFLKRWITLFKLLNYEFVFIHREAAPLGPPVFEWVIAKVLKKKVVYDFDDAIWLTDEKARLSNFIRCFWKVSKICKWSYKVSCGNNYLVDYARQWNQNVVLNPTTIDTEHHQFVESVSNDKCVVGWTGSHSTLKYLDLLAPVLKQLEDRVELVVICNKNPAYDLKHFRFIPWSKENEVIGLSQIDIGIMPLPDDEWTQGKCGFKALQYMSMKKVVVISPVGVNNQIVNHEENGFLTGENKDWEEVLNKLIDDKPLREKVAESGYQTLISKYSVEANKGNFLSLFD